MKIVETIWFTGMYGCCGIVLGEDAITGERKAYLGVHRGVDEESDQELIASGGSKLTREIAEHILRHFDKEEVGNDKRRV